MVVENLRLEPETETEVNGLKTNGRPCLRAVTLSHIMYMMKRNANSSKAMRMMYQKSMVGGGWGVWTLRSMDVCVSQSMFESVCLIANVHGVLKIVAECCFLELKAVDIWRRGCYEFVVFLKLKCWSLV